MQDAASEWTKAWRIIAASLKELGVPYVDANARAIIARLAAENMLIVDIDNVKDERCDCPMGAGDYDESAEVRLLLAASCVRRHLRVCRLQMQTPSSIYRAMA